MQTELVINNLSMYDDDAHAHSAQGGCPCPFRHTSRKRERHLMGLNEVAGVGPGQTYVPSNQSYLGDLRES